MEAATEHHTIKMKKKKEEEEDYTTPLTAKRKYYKIQNALILLVWNRFKFQNVIEVRETRSILVFYLFLRRCFFFSSSPQSQWRE